MHLSTAGQLAHPAEDGRQRTGRHRDRTVTNGHGLPGRDQSDNGGVRPCDDRWTDRERWPEICMNRLQQRRTEIIGTQAQLKVLNCRQRDAGGGGS